MYDDMRKIQYPKISVITVVKNGMPYIEDSINSFHYQKYKIKELIVICSKSFDGTEKFLRKNKKKIDKLIFDNKSLNKYEAINLGIKKASGDLIGVLHSDDFFTENNILKKIAKEYSKSKNIDLIYGNVLYCKRNNINKISRYWKSEKYQNNKINIGWMPPHTTMFLKKKLYKKNKYSSKYDISSDYELILKLFSKKINAKYLDLNILVMRLGGISTNLKYLLKKIYEDVLVLKSFKKNYLKIMPYKVLSKVSQLIFFKKKFFNFQKIKGDNLIIHDQILNFLKKRKTGFILSGLNLAFIGFINEIKPDRNFRLWPDGVFNKFFTKNIEKIAGRKILNKIELWCDKEIIIVGNLNEKGKEFFKRKNIKILRHVKLSYGSYDSLLKEIRNFSFSNTKKNTIVIVTLPTPKQEIVAKEIFSKNSNLNVLCLGGALNIASGYESPVPNLLEDLGLEFFWRLKTDPIRRSIRLFISFFKAITFGILFKNEYEFKQK